jgi:hypothetical protein
LRVAVCPQIGARKLRASERPSWLEFCTALASFALLLVAALSKPRLGPGLHFNEVKATIWATAIMLLPAMVLAPYGTWSRVIANLSSLYWTFGLLMFLIHLYCGVFTVFDGIADTAGRIGTLAVGFTCLLIGWWSLDVALIWLFGHSRRGIWLAHIAAQVFVFLVVAGGLVSHSGAVQKLGLLFVMGVLASLAIRLVLPDRATKAFSGGYAFKRFRISIDVGSAHGAGTARRSWERERSLHQEVLRSPKRHFPTAVSGVSGSLDGLDRDPSASQAVVSMREAMEVTQGPK